MRRTIFSLLFLVLTSAAAKTQAVRWSDCKPLKMSTPVRWPISISDIDIMSSDNFSSGHLTLVNTAGQPIEGFIIIAQLFDRDGSHLLTVPFYNDGAKLKAFPYQSWLQAHSVGVVSFIRPHETATLMFGSPLISRRCPALASIDYVQLWYDDAKAFSYDSQHLTLDSVITEAPEMNIAVQPPFLIRGEVHLDKYGNPIKAKSSNSDASAAEWVQTVRTWKFSPSVSAGEAVEGDLSVAIVFTTGPHVIPWSALEGVLGQGIRSEILLSQPVELGKLGSWKVGLPTTSWRIGKLIPRESTKDK